MEEPNIKRTFLYQCCFFFALLEVLSLLGLVAYLGNNDFSSPAILFLLVLLLLWVYNLFSMWKPRLGGVKFFLVMKALAFVGMLIWWFVNEFNQPELMITALLIQFFIIRAFYKLMIRMPFEY